MKIPLYKCLLFSTFLCVTYLGEKNLFILEVSVTLRLFSVVHGAVDHQCTYSQRGILILLHGSL